MAEPAQDNNTIVATNGTVTTSPVTQSITTATHTTGASSANVIMVTSAPSNTQPSAVGVTIAPNTVATPTPLQIQASPIQIQSSTQQAVGTPITSTGAHRTQQMAPMQVIPNQTYIQQQYIQQQLMLQAAMQAQGLSPQQLNLAVQNRPPSGGPAPKSPSLMAPTTGMILKTTASSPITVNPNPLMSTAVNVKATGTIVTQASSQIGGKPIMQRQSSQPLVIGQLGVLSNQTVPVSSHLVNQSKSPTLTTQAQMLPNPTQIRLTSQQTLVTNTGQIINAGQPTMITNQAMLNHLQFPSNIMCANQDTLRFSPHFMCGNQETLRAMATLQQNQLGQQPILASQAATILSSQPLYIRAATPIHQQQGIMGNMQPVMPATTKAKTIEMAPANMQIKASVVGQQKVSGQVTKGTTQVLPSGGRMVNQAGSPLVTAQVQPNNLTLASMGPARTTVTQVKQVNRVKGLKSQSKPSSPVQPPATQARAVQAKPTVSTQQPPTVAVQPKIQQQVAPNDHKKDTMKTNIKVEKTPTPPPPQPSLVAVASKGADKGNAVNVGHNGVRENSGSSETVNGSSSQNSGGSGDNNQDEPMDIDRPEDHGKDGPATLPVSEKQKAIVKPHILTHVIEGFVIQEGAEPFPVQRSSLLTEFLVPREPKPQNDLEVETLKDKSRPAEAKVKPEKKKMEVELGGAPSPQWEFGDDVDEYDNKPKLKCEFCGKVNYANKFKGSKRFCSMACAKRYNVGCSRRMGLFKGLENGNKYHKKPKDLSSHRAWSRSQGGRVSTGPIQRVRAGNTDSDSPPQSETDTDTQSSGATPIPSEPLPASEKVTHPQPALPEAKTPQHDRPSETSSATTASTGSDGTSGEEEQNSSLSPHESSPPRSPPVLEREGDLDTGTEPPRKRLTQWSISTDSSSDRMSPARLNTVQVEDDVCSTPEPRKHITQWSVQDVHEFIESLAGCAAYAGEFRAQEIDGQALLLLKEDHLMSAMNMKLGPALKICARITALKDEMT